MISHVLKFLQLHVGLSHVFFLSFLGENRTDFMVDAEDGGLRGFDGVVVDVELEEFVSCFL